jgi:hypothetical protein
VRIALRYVLLNARKHARARGAAEPATGPRFDPASSGRWFDGWADGSLPAGDPPAVASAETWLLKAGWRRHGLLRSHEVPGGERAHRAQRLR